MPGSTAGGTPAATFPQPLPRERGVPGGLEAGILRGGNGRMPCGKMPPSTAGGTPAATACRHRYSAIDAALLCC